MPTTINFFRRYIQIRFGRDEIQTLKIERIWIAAFTLNVMIIVLSILRILFAGNMLVICERQNAFFTTLTETQIGISFLVISIAGTTALCLNIASEHPFVILSRAYLVAMLVATAALIVLIIVGFVFTSGDGGEDISGKAYKEYRLGSYSSPTLQASISSPWNATRACLVDRNICESFIDQGTSNFTHFNSTRLSPIQSGCCKPSNDCGFTFISSNKWMKPIAKNANMTNSDCGLWRNDNKVLCYDCDACKAGMLQSVKDSWRKQGIIYIIFCVFLIIVLVVGYYSLPWKEFIRRDSLESKIIAACVPNALRCACCPCWS